jgi:hypothetical protein
MMKVAMAENYRKNTFRDSEENNKISSKSSLTIIFVSILFLIAGVGAFILIKNYAESLNQIPLSRPKYDQTIIVYDKYYPLEVVNKSRTELRDLIENSEFDSENRNVAITYSPIIEAVGDIDEKIYRQPLNISQFFDIFADRNYMPAEILRNLEPNFMFGIYTSSKKSTPFILAKIVEGGYGVVKNGLWDWEQSRNMAFDMQDVFFSLKEAVLNSGSSDLVSSGIMFQDEKFNNYNLRVLLNKNDDVLLYYVFLDMQKKLLIAKDLQAIKEITQRLALE